MNEVRFLLFIILFFFLQSSAFAQNGTKEEIEQIKERVVSFFNNKQADSIYNLTGENFQKVLSKENFRAISEQQLFPVGPIRSTELEKFESGVSQYKAVFDAIKLQLFIGLDAKGKLQTLLFQPYKEKRTSPFAKTATDNPLAIELDKRVDSIVQEFMFTSEAVGLSVGLMQTGKFYFYNYGETKKGNNIVPTGDNLYEIGSITKTFTGLLLAKAVIDDKIKLDDPINKYLPDSIPALKLGNDVVRIVHLSNHTSGLPRLPDNFISTDETNPYKDYDVNKMYSFLKTVKLASPPGKISSYSNFGVGLLGVILEKVYRQPYESLLQKIITAPGGMKNTVIHLNAKNESLFVQGYDSFIKEASPWNFDAFKAAGAIRSNTRDLLLYAKMNSEPNTVGRKQKAALELSHKTTFDDGNEKLGLGWFKRNWGRGEVLFHNGGTGGFVSFLAINPVTKDAVVLLCNTSVSTDKIGVALMRLLDKNL